MREILSTCWSTLHRKIKKLILTTINSSEHKLKNPRTRLMTKTSLYRKLELQQKAWGIKKSARRRDKRRDIQKCVWKFPLLYNSHVQRVSEKRSSLIEVEKGKLIPITKPGKEKSEDVSKYRPINLLNTWGNDLEKALINRINHHVFPTISWITTSTVSRPTGEP